jgi:exodeoxyribonuclease V gamma subunit
MLYVHQSSNLASLSVKWNSVLDLPRRGSVLCPSTVLVPNMDVAHWLQVNRAEQSGISANIDFQLPAGFFRKLFEREHPLVATHLLDKSTLRWMVFVMLGDVVQQGEYPKEWGVLMDWVARPEVGADTGGSSQGTRWDLAGQVADVFDQYIMYRPEWLVRWAAGEAVSEVEPLSFMHQWQPSMWRSLVERWPEYMNRATLMMEWIERYRSGDIGVHGLPESIYVFNVHQAPPVLIEGLLLCSKVVDVHWFLSLHTFEDAYRDRFFTGLNTDQTEFVSVFKQLITKHSIPVQWEAATEDTGSRSAVLETSDGVLIHKCHSAHREVEVLRDRLLHLFNTTELRPGDVAVVTPDPDRYAPYMREVFQSTRHDDLSIPVRIHGGRQTDRQLVAEVFLQALKLSSSRFKTSELLDWLGLPPVLGTYLDENRLRVVLNRWVEEQMIRWGSGTEHLESLDFELNGRHTWQHGLERLLLSRIGSEDQDYIFNDTLSGSALVSKLEAELLGRVIHVWHALERLRKAAESKKRISEWIELLQGMLDSIIDPSWSDRTDAVRNVLFKMTDLDEKLGVEPISIAIVGSYLKEIVQKGGLGRSWHPGEVTFTGMVSLHMLPFKVIAVLGLNDGSLPARNSVSAFDLVPKHQHPGDRVRRTADRQLFLDYLFAASEHLHLSYTGLRQTDNKSLAPSVLLPMLTDHIKRLSDIHGFYEPREIQHRLQPFHPVYFSPEAPIVSYSKLNAQLAVSISQPTRRDRKALIPVCSPSLAADFFNRSELMEGADANGTLSLSVSDLDQYFRDPDKYMVNRLVGIDLYEQKEPNEDEEPFVIDHLRAWQIRNDIIQESYTYLVEHGTVPDSIQQDNSIQDLLAGYELKGWIPDAIAGRKYAQIVISEAQLMLEEFFTGYAQAGSGPLESRRIEVEVTLTTIGRVSISGEIHGVVGQTHLVIETSKANPGRRFRNWIRHVLLNTVQETDTEVFYRGEPVIKERFKAMGKEEALSRLTSLVWIWFVGQHFALPLYPALASEFIHKLTPTSSSEAQLATLMSILDIHLNPESEYPNDATKELNSIWSRHLWRDKHPLDESLKSCSNGLDEAKFDVSAPLIATDFTQMDVFRLFSWKIIHVMERDVVA